jgi:uncharacterized protein YdhG (YjbR/CyaY superfamily)
VLGELRALIKQAVPKAAETMSYGMPNYELGRQGCAIASQKQYLGLYGCETEALDESRDDFAHLNVGKSCIRFTRLDQLPMPRLKAVLRSAAKRAK